MPENLAHSWLFYYVLQSFQTFGLFHPVHMSGQDISDDRRSARGPVDLVGLGMVGPAVPQQDPGGIRPRSGTVRPPPPDPGRLVHQAHSSTIQIKDDYQSL
jgi:hypothetical protein